jgi:hypothetical protein
VVISLSDPRSLGQAFYISCDLRLVALYVDLFKRNTSEVHQLVRRSHLGPSTLKMHFWVHELVESFTAGP